MMRRTIVILTAFVALAITTTTAAAEPARPQSDAERLGGTWLFDAAYRGDRNDLAGIWTSAVSITSDSFAVSKFMDIPKDLTGKVVLDPSTSPKSIVLKLNEFDLSEFAGSPMKIPACTLPGIYKLDGDRLTLSFTIEIGGKRPATFDQTGDKVARVSLVKATGFQGFPQEVTVKVTGTDGKPVAGATVTGTMQRRIDPKTKAAEPDWQYYPAIKTGADGTAKIKYEQLRSYSLVVRHAETGQMAVTPVTPLSLTKGEVAVTLGPECRVTGTIVCPELTDSGRPIGWTGVYALQDGRRVAFFSGEGTFDFVLPPGSYTLNAYGSEVRGRNVPVTVPAGRSEFTAEPIALAASVLTRLQKRPAPELADLVGWKGTPVKLADLKGKYVLLEFWGYWCGPCVGSMPVLIELHEKFADKGLVIIGVHADMDGEVDTAAKLDEKVAAFRKGIWKGKDLPFPVALTSGKQVGEGDAKEYTGPAGQYGVRSWPTTVLIDRDGKVVGQFHARGAKMAAEELEKLLNGNK